MTTLGLVADYGSSSEYESDEDIRPISAKNPALNMDDKSVNYFDSTEKMKPKKKQKERKKKVDLLVNPLRSNKSSNQLVDASTSVFYNPFKREQETKTEILETHVKLTINPKDVNEINGKKICWNYRKGRCKFGHKCKYAHDSDLIGATSQPQLQQNNTDQASEFYNMQSIPNCVIKFDNDSQKEFRKRKPGLAQGLIPNKKSRQMYKDIQLKEKPWLQKKKT